MSTRGTKSATPAKTAPSGGSRLKARAAKGGASATAARTARGTAAPRSSEGTVKGRSSAARAKGSGGAASAKKATAARSTRQKESAPRSVSKRSGARKAAAAPVDRFLEEQRSLLLAERATYLQQAESLLAEAEQLAQEMEPGDIQFDEESGEGGTLNVERERDLALSAQARQAVEEIDRALEKIDAGTYGTCERCGEPIPKARLKALPQAALCVSCKSGGLARR